MSDPLLVGELENFPPEAQEKIEAAGGLKRFLLGSRRFVMCNGGIGLASHVEFLQHTLDDDREASLLASFPFHSYSMDDSEAKGSSHLNPKAKEFLPQSNHLSGNDSSDSYDNASCPVLPNPYDLSFDYLFPQDIPEFVEDPEFTNHFHDFPLTAFNTDAFSSDNNYINFNEDISPRSKNMFVQVRQSFKSVKLPLCALFKMFF